MWWQSTATTTPNGPSNLAADRLRCGERTTTNRLGLIPPSKTSTFERSTSVCVGHRRQPMPKNARVNQWRLCGPPTDCRHAEHTINVSDNHRQLRAYYYLHRTENDYTTGQNSYLLNVVLPCMATINNRVSGAISDEDHERLSRYDTKENSRTPNQELTANARGLDTFGTLPVDSTADCRIRSQLMEKY